MILMATKSHKNPAANEAGKAPIGARNFFDRMADDFCAFLWQKKIGGFARG
jgi:hypothetical protein